MITKTSREIIKTAKTLANADNSAFTDFFSNTTFLNNAYREVYDILVSNSKAFINKIEVTEDTVLPYDCYGIISVTDKSGRPVHQEAMVGNTSNGWSVENNVFVYPKQGWKNTSLLITYATIPATITAPDNWVEVSFDDTDYDPTISHSVVFDKDTSTITLTDDGASVQYVGGPLVWDVATQTVTWKGMDFYDYISRQDENNQDIKFTSIQVDSPYMAITYEDGKCFIFTGWQATEYNYKCLFGHETLGECLGLTTDDTTGFGMLWKDPDTGKYFHAPFVPDTILSYPNNTLFAYLEYRIAFQIASLLNINTEFLSKELEKAESNFYKNIGESNNVHRMNNFHRGPRVFI